MDGVDKAVLKSKIDDIISSIRELERLVSKPFHSLSIDERYSMRYNIIVLVESLFAMCLGIAVAEYGKHPSSYREGVKIVAERFVPQCVNDLLLLVESGTYWFTGTGQLTTAASTTLSEPILDVFSCFWRGLGRFMGLEVRYYRVVLSVVAEKLRNALAAMDEVEMAFLFGSVLGRELVRDVDVAVHVFPDPGLLGYVSLSNSLEEVVGVPVDVVPLMEVSPQLRLKILGGGLELVVRDRGLFWKMLCQAVSEVADVEMKLSISPPAGLRRPSR